MTFGMKTGDLLRGAQEVHERWPGATLVRNMVGNLAVVTPDETWVAWLDLATGEVIEFSQLDDEVPSHP